MKIRSILLLVLVLLLAFSAPGAAAPLPGHDMTFINTCEQPIWINLQGGPKGICDHDFDNDAKTIHTQCSACSFCKSGDMCNTSAATGNTSPLCCPGTKKDRNLCWGGGGCVKGGCCPGIPQSHNLPYACPEAGDNANMCPEHNLTIAQINGLTGYNNPDNHISRTVCNGSLISNGGFMLNALNGTRRFVFDHGWQGALYPRTGCSFNEAGVGSCLTGNCVDNLGTSVLECGGAGSAAPVTKTEINFDSPNDWYDVSWVDGFNVAMVIEPTKYDQTYLAPDPAHQCKTGGCSVGLASFFSPDVPDWNSLKYPSTSNFAGILSDCNHYTNLMDSKAIPMNDETNRTKYGYCCPISEGYVNNSAISCGGTTPEKCKTCAGQDNNLFPFNQTGALPNSAKLFYHTCPVAYAYTYNDTDALFQCWGNTTVQTGYRVTISCPVLVPTLTPAPAPRLESPGSSDEEPISTAVISPGGSEGEPLAFVFNDFTRSGGSSAVSDTTIHHVHVNTTEKTGEIILRVTKNPGLGSVPGLTGHAFAIYYQIESPHLQSSQVGSAIIEFSVKEKTLTTFGLKPEDVVLMHWDGTRWTALPTVFDYGTNGRAYYSATTPGFSLFAITDKGASQGAATGTTLPLTVLPSLKSVADIGTAAPVSSAAVQVTIPAVSRDSPGIRTNLSPASSPADTVPGFPVLALGGIVAGCLATGGGWYARRWWIRRQNPALFEDMD